MYVCVCVCVCVFVSVYVVCVHVYYVNMYAHVEFLWGREGPDYCFV